MQENISFRNGVWNKYTLRDSIFLFSCQNQISDVRLNKANIAMSKNLKQSRNLNK